jgi:alkylhydroperoxidase/carboxymuconolactone decarboxylase family protein YurZ
VRALVHLKATREQVNEMLAIAVYMGGGPSLMYAAEVLAAYEEFQASK